MLPPAATWICAAQTQRGRRRSVAVARAWPWSRHGGGSSSRARRRALLLRRCGAARGSGRRALERNPSRGQGRQQRRSGERRALLCCDLQVCRRNQRGSGGVSEAPARHAAGMATRRATHQLARVPHVVRQRPRRRAGRSSRKRWGDLRAASCAAGSAFWRLSARARAAGGGISSCRGTGSSGARLRGRLAGRSAAKPALHRALAHAAVAPRDAAERRALDAPHAPAAACSHDVRRTASCLGWLALVCHQWTNRPVVRLYRTTTDGRFSRQRHCLLRSAPRVRVRCGLI